jgi:hypothetical protein
MANPVSYSEGHMVLPDYQGGSIVNLMASIIEGLGGRSAGYSPLAALPVLEVAKYRQVALIVVDGLGYDFLTRVSPIGGLNALLRGSITSVFPSTTASAITTFLTGVAPQQHGLTGWHMYFRELGAVLAVLPGVPRYGGCNLRLAGIDVRRFFGHQPVFDRLPVESHVVAPQSIIRSDFNLAHQGRASLSPFKTREQFFEAIGQGLQPTGERKFVYGYWSELDHLSHAKGPHSSDVLAHFTEWAEQFMALTRALAGSDTLFVVTADHGFIDSDESHTIALEDHPVLADSLILPLCGEGRAAFCYVKPTAVSAFEGYILRELADAVTLYRSSTLLEQGWFGIGAPHQRLAERIGDYVLLMKDNYVIRDRLQSERKQQFLGVHGGVSAREMRVPLLVAGV